MSRNFRRQKVGDINWLKDAYNFGNISKNIDELVILNISNSRKGQEHFSEILKALSKFCFMPIAAGGMVRTIDDALSLFRSGADKVVVNTLLFEDLDELLRIKREFGQQAIIGSIDIKYSKNGSYDVLHRTDAGNNFIAATKFLTSFDFSLIGEVYLNSIDRDGTGQGLDLDLLKQLPKDFSIPLIIAGGVGNTNHLEAGFKENKIDAVATANLFNFLGDGLWRARIGLLEQGINLANWYTDDLVDLGLK
jgi:cyclase